MKIPDSSPSPADVLSASASQALQQGHIGQAIDFARHALAADASCVAAMLILCRCARLAGHLPEAGHLSERALACAPTDPSVLMEAAAVRRQLGDLPAAESLYRQALQHALDWPGLHQNLANVLQRKGDLAGAEHHYRQALSIHPRLVEAHTELGNVLMSTQRKAEAQLSFARALAIRPDFTPAWDRLNAALSEGNAIENIMDLQRGADDPVAATELLLRLADAALQLSPGNALGYYMRGMALRLSGNWSEALAPLAHILQHGPDAPLYQQALFVHTLCLMDMGEQAGAMSGVRKLQTLATDMTERAKACQIEAGLLLSEGLADQALALYRQAMAFAPDFRPAKVSYCASLLYADGATGEQQPHAAMAMLGAPFEDEIDTTPAPRRVSHQNPLRVGFLSGDFRQHSCAYFLKPLLTHLQLTGIEAFAYSTEGREDAFTQDFKQWVPNWRNVSRMSDEQTASLMQSDSLDILIDLAGLTDRNRMGVVARKPAPLVLNWLGFLGSTGLPTVDWRVTDAWVDAPQGPAFGGEPALRLDRVYLAYAPPQDAPEVAPPPVLRSGHITFGSFNSLAKLSDRCLAMWCDVLHAVPDSRLLIKSKYLKDASMRDRLKSRFMALGVEDTRLDLTGWQATTSHHLANYADIDIALDSSPFNGVTTTCEASWMGVPVVSLIGSTPAARQGLTLLTALGHAERATSTPEDFVRTCVELASAPDLLARARKLARQRMATSPLMDGAGFARSFEAALRTASKLTG